MNERHRISTNKSRIPKRQRRKETEGKLTSNQKLYNLQSNLPTRLNALRYFKSILIGRHFIIHKFDNNNYYF